jgi:predicted ester cyclase
MYNARGRKPTFMYGNRPFLVAFPDFKHEIDSMVAEAGKVTARVTLTGTHEGEYMGVPPTGNKINYTAMLEARFSEGKIVEAWGVWGYSYLDAAARHGA